VKKNYQTKTAAVATAVEAVMPDAVSVTRAELAGSLREGPLALAVGTGFQVMEAIIDDSVSVLAGPKGQHDPNPFRHRLACTPNILDRDIDIFLTTVGWRVAGET